ncbi:Ndr family protein [Dirofilaria immitis]|nr:Ndr family protein [Dirofilaria immitis]
MADVKAKSIFAYLHSCFPTLDQIGEDLVCVLDKLDVKTCIAFGEGAGANIICRFAVNVFSKSNYGNLSGALYFNYRGIIEYCKDKLINMRLEAGVMSQGAWDYLAMHKFGSTERREKQAYIEELKNCLNPKNLSKYLYSFSKRSDISSLIGTKLDNMDALLVTGARASHLHTVYTTHKSMNKRKTTLLVVDNVSDVMAEAPEKLARSLILLCKGCGVLSGVAIPGMERQRTLSSSMEEADRPRRFSLSQPTAPVYQ